MAASGKFPVGARPPPLPSFSTIEGPAILVGWASECSAEAESQLRPSAIGRRLRANSEYSIITNYVSTRRTGCKGVVGVKNPEVGVYRHAAGMADSVAAARDCLLRLLLRASAPT